jgi:hypothetical protein
MQKLHSEFKGPNFEAISISLDGGEMTDTTREDVVRFVNRATIGWKVLFDDTGMDNVAAVAYGVKTLPMHILIDQAGVVRKIVVGADWHNQMALRIRRLLKDKPATVVIGQ